MGAEAAGGVGSPPRALPERIIVVCVGNICRSPMAQALLARELRRAGHGVRVESAGIAACVGVPADPCSVALMDARGLDIGDHRGRQLHPAHVDAHTQLLCTAAEQARWIVGRRPGLAGQVALLGEFGVGDIVDPVGGSLALFEQALAEIEAGIDGWLARGWLPGRADGGGAAEPNEG